MRERIEIYRIHLSKLKRDPSKFDLEALSQASQDLSGREIEQALREAMYDAFHDGIDISTQIILKVLAKKTSLLTTMSESLKSMLTWVGWDKDKKDGIRARFAHPVEEDNLARLQDQINQLIQDVEKEGNAPGVENGPTI
jgi:SpoVK/Ycf46/Vps4 family AAA+-type ATPase